MQIVRSHFRPEFLNRLDDMLLFRRLSRDVMGGIVDIQLLNWPSASRRRALAWM